MLDLNNLIGTRYLNIFLVSIPCLVSRDFRLSCQRFRRSYNKQIVYRLLAATNVAIGSFHRQSAVNRMQN